MDRIYRVVLLITLLSLPLVGYSQIADGAINPENEEIFFRAGFVTMIFIVLTATAIMTIIGIAIAAFALMIILISGFLGVLSTSLLWGWYQRSLQKGVKSFFILGFGFLGLLSGSVVFPLINEIMKWAQFEYAIITGIVTGCLAGIVTGYISFQGSKWLLRKIISKIGIEGK